MEKEELKQLAQSDFSDLTRKIFATKSESKYEDLKKQYLPELHDIRDESKRPDKLIETDNGPSKSKVSRLSIPLQKKIVRLAASILCGNPIQIESNASTDEEKLLIDLVKKVWEDNKLDYESKNLAKLMMSETECAELWYGEEASTDYWEGTANDGKRVRFRVKILAPSLGDKLYPVFNSYGDMIAFGRGYELKSDNGVRKECFDLYTPETNYLSVKSSSGWDVKSEANRLGEIPIIYYQQDNVEWADVQCLIDRLELSISNHGDTNDYFGSPSYFIEGEIDGFAKKGEQGKVFKGSAGAKMHVISWDQSPESVKLEQQNLRSLIFDGSDTPDITKDNEDFSNAQSGVALQMRFLPAHLKAADKEEIFGKCIQRRMNFLVKALVKINSALAATARKIKIRPKFEYYVPKNLVEKIDLLSTARQGGILSQKTAIALNPLVVDADAEYKQLQEEGLNNQQNEEL